MSKVKLNKSLTPGELDDVTDDANEVAAIAADSDATVYA